MLTYVWERCTNKSTVCQNCLVYIALRSVKLRKCKNFKNERVRKFMIFTCHRCEAKVNWLTFKAAALLPVVGLPRGMDLVQNVTEQLR